MKRPVLQVSMPPQQVAQLEEIANFRGLTKPEVMRSLIDNYYTGEFRKIRFGYGAGLVSGKRKQKVYEFKESIEGKLDDIETMTDEELTDLVNTSGYITDEEKVDRIWFVGVDELTFNRQLFYSYKTNPASKISAFTLKDLKPELKKFFKMKKRDETK